MNADEEPNPNPSALKFEASLRGNNFSSGGVSYFLQYKGPTCLKVLTMVIVVEILRLAVNGDSVTCENMRG